MKLFIPLVILSTSTLLADSIPVNARIDAAMVYQDRARITRIAETQIPPGDSVVQIAGLPLNIDDSSVQVSGLGSEKIKILGLEVRRKFAEKTSSELIRKLQDQIQSIDDELQKHEDELRDLNDRKLFLQNLRDNMTKELGKEVKTNELDTSKLKNAYEFYGQELKTLTVQIRDVELKRRELQPKRQKLQDEMDRSKAGSSTTNKEALVAVHSENASSLKLTLNYVVPGACWYPVYDARARLKDSKIDLSYNAMVRQTTGEDWKDVKLSLSTARPHVNGWMKELQPWFVKFFSANPRESYSYAMRKAKSVDQLEDEKDVAAAPAVQALNGLLKEERQDLPAEALTASMDTHGVSSVFHVKVPIDIPSDGEPHQTAISIQSFKGDFHYVTTPKIIQTAFLKSHITNETDTPILAGNVNLFLEDDLIGKSHMKYIAPTADFDFYLGTDEGIKIDRKPVVEKTDKEGLFSLKKKKVLIRKYEITVQNFKPTTEKVTIYDQIPVSQNSEIEVTEVKFSEAPHGLDKESGKVDWEISLKPRETKKLTLEFQVIAPDDKEIAGI